MRVIFNDDDNNEETSTSEATAGVAAETAVPDAPRSLNVSPDDTGTLDVFLGSPSQRRRLGHYQLQGPVEVRLRGLRRKRRFNPARRRSPTRQAGPTPSTGLTDGVEYTVRVIAVNDVGDGPPSDEATGTPRETTPPEACYGNGRRDDADLDLRRGPGTRTQNLRRTPSR